MILRLCAFLDRGHLQHRAADGRIASCIDSLSTSTSLSTAIQPAQPTVDFLTCSDTHNLAPPPSPSTRILKTTLQGEVICDFAQVCSCKAAFGYDLAAIVPGAGGALLQSRSLREILSTSYWSRRTDWDRDHVLAPC